MYFKAKIIDGLDEYELPPIQIEFDQINAKEIILFDGHDFEIERNADGRIVDLTFCNQCIDTYNIEEVFIKLLIYLLRDEQNLTLIDSNGTEEEMTREDLEELFG